MASFRVIILYLKVSSFFVIDCTISVNLIINELSFVFHAIDESHHSTLDLPIRRASLIVVPLTIVHITIRVDTTS